MFGVYAFLKRHAVLTGIVLVAAVAAEGAYIWAQRAAQSKIIEELTRPGALSDSIILTATETEETFFERRDRFRVTLASSLFSSDPSQPPLTVDVDVVASFTPLGLSGDIYPLNRTPSTVKLLAALEGIHPKITIRYAFSLLTNRLSVRAKAEPFDMRLSQFELGVGPMSWHVFAEKPVVFKGDFGLKDASATISAKNLRLEVSDPAGYELGAAVEDADLTNVYRTQPRADALVWTLASSEGRSGRAAFWVGDWRGAFNAQLERVRSRAKQTADADSDALNGHYDFAADRADLTMRSRRFLKEDLAVRLDAIKGDWTAENVPLALMEPIDDIALERILRRAGLMHLKLNEFAFRSGSQQGSLSASVVAGFKDGAEPVLKAELSAHLPESTAPFLDVMMRGNRRAFSDLHLLDFMRREVHGGEVCYLADFAYDLAEDDARRWLFKPRAPVAVPVPAPAP